MPDKGLTSHDYAAQDNCVGRIAYSAAGRDRKRAFVIVAVCEEKREDGMVFIADGKLHTLAKPKLKNLKHLRITGETVSLRDADDEMLREYLKSY